MANLALFMVRFKIFRRPFDCLDMLYQPPKHAFLTIKNKKNGKLHLSQKILCRMYADIPAERL